MSEMNAIFKETSLIDEVKSKLTGRRPTLAEAQQQAKLETQPDDNSLLKQE